MSTPVTVVRGSAVATADGVRGDHEVVVRAGRIDAVRPIQPAGAHTDVIEVAGGTVIPGLIDLHVHGGNGYDTLDPEPAALRAISAHLARHGVTTFLPTTVTASREAIDTAVANTLAVGDDVPGARPRGLHLEGPYLAVEQAGAQPVAWLRAPDPAEYLPWFDSGAVSRITIAPELPGIDQLIADAVTRGVRPTIGHTACSGEQAKRAIELGARAATHVFSGMDPLRHRTPGALSVCLSDDRVFAEAIVDGVHIHPEIVALLLRIVGKDRMVLVSDAIRAAGLGDGTYRLGDSLVEVRDGETRRSDGGLAGSILTLDVAVRNVMRFAGLALPDALRLATTNAARALGWEHDLGSLDEGRVADLVVLDPDNAVVLTMVGGRVVFDARVTGASGPVGGGNGAR